MLRMTPRLGSPWLLVVLGACQGAHTLERRWVYVPPREAGGVNVATLECPPADGSANRVLPQLGDLTLVSRGGAALEGKTDQGCTWRFERRGRGVELRPAGQSCHNAVFDLDYSIDRWVLEPDASGAMASETLLATSHQPGMDCRFQLTNGRRAAVSDDQQADTTTGYVGAWAYTAADPRVGSNFSMRWCPTSPSERPAPRLEPVSGSYVFTATSGHTVEATGGDGCRWTFDVHAGAARLDPLGQRCAHPDGTLETRSYWAITSDGARQQEILRGEELSPRGLCVAIIANGTRTRGSTP